MKYIVKTKTQKHTKVYIQYVHIIFTVSYVKRGQKLFLHGDCLFLRIHLPTLIGRIIVATLISHNIDYNVQAGAL